MTIPKAPKRPGRTKKTRKKDRKPSKLELFHMGRIKEGGCACCNERFVDYHHEYRGGRIRDHKHGYGLCPEHHTDGDESRHKMGYEGFSERWGFDPDELSEANWEESMRLADV